MAAWLGTKNRAASKLPPPDGYAELVVAERFGQLPDTIENSMSEYWFNRALALMEGEGIAAKEADKPARKR